MRAIEKEIPVELFMKIFNDLTDNREGEFSEDFTNGKYKLHISAYPHTYYSTIIGKEYYITLSNNKTEFIMRRESTDKELYDYMGNRLTDSYDFSEFIYSTKDLSNLEAFNNLEPNEIVEFIERVVDRCAEVIKESSDYWKAKKKNLMESI